MIKELKNWDNATDKLAEAFVEKYFGKDLIYDDDYYWVGTKDKDREILVVNDYFFNIGNIISFIRYKYSVKKMFEYYDYALKFDNKKQDEFQLPIRTYIQLKK